MSAIAALSGHDVSLLVLILAVAVLLGAAYTASRGRVAQAGVIAVIGVILLLLAS